MKLLFLTQVLDNRDAVLGFVPRWVRGLAACCERVRVVALEVGDTRGLPENVDVRELGRKGRVGRWLKNRGFLREALAKDGFDAVLAHMVPRYALLAAGPTRAAGAGLYLWFTHGGTSPQLVRSVEQVDKIFTASEASMRIDTPKRVVTGHGIDLEHFTAPAQEPAGPPRILAVGRITPRKDPLTLVDAVALLAERGRDVRLELAGAPLAPGDEAYREQLEQRIAAAGLGDRVELHGSVPYPEIPALYQRCSVLVNPSSTGSIDKVVLEAMACERPVLTCNDSFPPLFEAADSGLAADAPRLVFQPGDAQGLAAALEAHLDLEPDARADLGRRLRALVERDHEVDVLMRRLVAEMRAGR